MRLGLGIDTGGTYTDSVIAALDTGEVLAKAKALTTREDLVLGIRASLAQLDRELLTEVRLVGLSTTLATNSIVERKGARVALLLAVPNPANFALPPGNPAEHTVLIAGAIARDGSVAVPLDTAAAREAIERLAGQVDAFAVSGYFSIYNQEQELKLKELVAECSELPVVCGHELSGDVGLLERAVTAALNARLLPVIGDLLAAVRAVLDECGVLAPVMVVKGNGALVSAAVAAQRPVETILSGPAASVVGACRLTGLADAVVVDMGGTTSDIALMQGGMVATSREGAQVGGWHTRVHSVEIRTAGIGGDSKVAVSGGSLVLGPRRAIPLCRAAHQDPRFAELLRERAAATARRARDGESEFCTLVQRPRFPVSSAEERLFSALEGRVLDRAELALIVGPFVELERFIALGVVAEVAFTPTDLLHAKGELALWDAEASRAGASLLARELGLSDAELLDAVAREVTESLKLNIVEKLLEADHPQPVFRSAQGRELLGALLRSTGGTVATSFAVTRPLVAVGAPVSCYFPQVAEELAAELVIPEHAEVANAFGAVTGRVVERAEALIRPDDADGFLVISAEERRPFVEFAAAQAYAEALVRGAAARRAQESGGAELEISVASEELAAPLGKGWGDSVLIERRVTATAVGLPSFIA